MFTVFHRFTKPSLSIVQMSLFIFSFFLFFFSIFFSSTASAHPKESSMLQTVFGENMTHWLLSHQGLAIVFTFSTIALLTYYSILVYSAKNALEKRKKVKLDGTIGE